MTNSIGYANRAGADLGTLALESLRVTDATKARAEEVIRSWLPDDEVGEILTILGLGKDNQ